MQFPLLLLLLLPPCVLCVGSKGIGNSTGGGQQQQNWKVERRHDTHDAAGLSAVLMLVQQQMTTTARMEAELADHKTQLQRLQQRVDDAAPTPVFFTAHMTTPVVHMGNNSPLRFDGVVTNIGAGYNPHTGVFTAPVTGIYVFYAQLMKHGNAKWVHWGIYKALEPLCANALDESTPSDKSSCLATVRLQKGDSVIVSRMTALGDSGHTLEGRIWCSFSGYLASLDN